jgi:hypothetical protein
MFIPQRVAVLELADFLIDVQVWCLRFNVAASPVVVVGVQICYRKSAQHPLVNVSMSILAHTSCYWLSIISISRPETRDYVALLCC